MGGAQNTRSVMDGKRTKNVLEEKVQNVSEFDFCGINLKIQIMERKKLDRTRYKQD